MPTIKTKRFIIRMPRMSDAASIATHINDREIAKNTARIPYPYTLKDAKQFIKRSLKRAKQGTFGFIIEIEKEAVGGINLGKIIKGHKSEVGYWLARKHRGKGIMTEAVKILSKFAFDKYKLKRLQAHVFPFNKASMRVLEKCGFKREGLLKKAIKKKDIILDAYIYAKVK